MKTLTEEQANSIPSKSIGKLSIARVHLTNMNVGDIIQLDKSEWHRKEKSPIGLLRQLKIEEKKHYMLKTILDGSGWIIKRIK